MTNHIVTLERLYEENKTKEAVAYGTDLKAALLEVTGEIQSGNPVTDVILQERKKEAEQETLSVYSFFYLSNTEPKTSSDFPNHTPYKRPRQTA